MHISGDMYSQVPQKLLQSASSSATLLKPWKIISNNSRKWIRKGGEVQSRSEGDGLRHLEDSSLASGLYRRCLSCVMRSKRGTLPQHKTKQHPLQTSSLYPSDGRVLLQRHIPE